ncbi:hypothetical protein JCM8097_001309 [Rhodosporidiobolus ruineniae]
MKTAFLAVVFPFAMALPAPQETTTAAAPSSSIDLASLFGSIDPGSSGNFSALPSTGGDGSDAAADPNTTTISTTDPSSLAATNGTSDGGLPANLTDTTFDPAQFLDGASFEPDDANAVDLSAVYGATATAATTA